MLTSKQRAYLRSIAVNTETIFQIGKGGISNDLSAGVSAALEAREIIKIRVLETAPEEIKVIADTLADTVGADVVQIIGARIVLYRPSEKNHTVVLP